MNKRTLSLVLILAFGITALTHAQDPAGSSDTDIRGKLKAEIATDTPPKRKVLDLRKNKKPRKPVQKTTDEQLMPLIASPVFLPQTSSPGTAITASNGFLYVVVGQKIYKVSEKSLKTVKVSQLGPATHESASDIKPLKPTKKLVATNNRSSRHKKKHVESKTD